MADVDPALVQQILDVPERKRKPNVQHHCEADDLGAAVKALEWVCFHHEDRLRKRPALINANPSDGVDGSTRTASQCAMLVLFATNREKEPST